MRRKEGIGVLAVADLVVVTVLVVTGTPPLLLGVLLCPVFAARLVQFRPAALKRNPLPAVCRVAVSPGRARC